MGFGQRVQALYCLGQLSRNETDDMLTISDIRNKCAHRPAKFSFGDAQVANRITSLKTWIEYLKINRRAAARFDPPLIFKYVAAALAFRLERRTKAASHCLVMPEPPISSIKNFPPITSR